MKILVTGFDSFGGEPINPAWEAVNKINITRPDIEVVKLQIPTVFGKGPAKIVEKIKEVHPDAVLSIGQAGGRANITVEYVGVNVRVGRIPDNEGNVPDYDPAAADGADAYISNLPTRAMVDAIKKAGLPASMSFTAGAYVCNDVLYSIRYYGEHEGKGLKSGFIHVPFIASQVLDKPATTPWMSLDDIVRALEAAIVAIADNA